MIATVRLKGGPGSGHVGHAGRPGSVGGSVPGTGGGVTPLGGAVSTSAPGSVRMAAVKHAKKEIARTASRLEMTPGDVQAKIIERLDEDLAQPVSIRSSMDRALTIVADGRFKTQFETGTSSGLFEPDRREIAEENGLGVSAKIPLTDRPMYGYFGAGEPDVKSYGNIEFVLKDSVRARTTYTIGDSLEGFTGQYKVGGSHSADTAAWGGNLDAYAKYGVGRTVRSIKWPDYIEAQIHGGVSLKDVAKVVIHTRAVFPGQYDAVRDALIAKGIEWEYD